MGNLSYPGCWAYPDMLEVGCQHGPGGAKDPGLSMAETRTHFGAWAIVSSPLTLSHDVNNDTIMDEIWPVISNKEVIAVSQTYTTFSGGPFKTSSETITLDNVNHAALKKGMTETPDPTVSASWQYLYKPLSWDGTKTAVLLINSADTAQDLELILTDVPGVTGPCEVRDIWEHKDLGEAPKSMVFSVESHDAAFVTLHCTTGYRPPVARGKCCYGFPGANNWQGCSSATACPANPSCETPDLCSGICRGTWCNTEEVDVAV